MPKQLHIYRTQTGNTWTADGTGDPVSQGSFNVTIEGGFVEKGHTYWISEGQSVDRNSYDCKAGARTGGTARFEKAIGLTALAATQYAISVDMSEETVNALDQGGFFLYAFKGVQTTQKGGAPTVWFQTETFSISTDISWVEQYQAYSSKSKVVPNGQIKASASYDIDLGQTFKITSDKGTGEVVQGGTSGAISIHNETQTQFTSGISQVVEGKASPLCAFPQYGGNLNVMAPIQKVLLMFSTLPVNTGTVIYQAYSSGGLFDLTGVTERHVSFDINKGWSWGGGAWGRQVQANADLVPLLIESSAELEERALAALSV